VLLAASIVLIVYGLAGVLFARAMSQHDPLRSALESHEGTVRASPVIARRVLGTVVLLVGVVLALTWLLETRH
jgi:hypothetical protein